MNGFRSIWRDEMRACLQDPRWVTGFGLSLLVSFFHIAQQLRPVAGTSLYPYFVSLAVLSPTCLAVAVLRLLGLPWRRALLLFAWMPLAFLASLVLFVLAGVYLYFSGAIP